MGIKIKEVSYVLAMMLGYTRFYKWHRSTVLQDKLSLFGSFHSWIERKMG